MDGIDDVTVIVRSVGERTTAACRRLLCQLVPEDNLITIHEEPFAAAVAASFELGLERGLPWTLCIDADVLVELRALQHLVSAGKQTKDSVFEVQGKVIDKLFQFARPAGNHFYRTAHLSRALKHVPSGSSNARPETTVLRCMAADGLPWKQLELVVGLHDYEQYFRDIYRKAFFHAHKHRQFIPYLDPLWRRLSTSDGDYEIALAGLRAGIRYTGTVEIGVGDSYEQAAVVLAERGWSEKGALAATDSEALEVERLLDSFSPPPEHEALLMKEEMEPGEAVARRWTKRKIMARAIGWRRIVPWLMAQAIRRVRRRSMTE